MTAARRPSFGLGVALLLVKALPRHAVTRCLGWIATRSLPQRLQEWQIRLFARAVGADLEEALEPPSSYRTLQDFFVRRLHGEARPLHPDPTSIVAPCDGFWGESGTIDQQRLFQIKGSSYSLADLLGDGPTAHSFEGGRYATFYLSPRDYHRLHAPCDLHVTRVDYLPGDLWPVNRIGLEGIDGLFVANERVVVHAKPLDRPGQLCLVAVGATVVGKIRLCFDDLVMAGKPTSKVYDADRITCLRGEEWGRFELGSTLVMVSRRDTVELERQPTGRVLRLGSKIGHFPVSSAPDLGPQQRGS